MDRSAGKFVDQRGELNRVDGFFQIDKNGGNVPVQEDQQNYQEDSYSDPSLSYESLMAYSQQQEKNFSYPPQPENDSETNSATSQAQLFRPVVALESFLDAALSQNHIAEMAAWHWDQYQMYSNYMDLALDQGGNNNYLGDVDSRLNGLQTTQHLWKADVEQEIFAKFPTDKQIEEAMLSNSDHLKKYELLMPAAYKAAEENSQIRKRSLPVAGAATFRHPARVPTVSGAQPVANSQHVMDSLDSILGSDSVPKAPKMKPPKLTESTRGLESTRGRPMEDSNFEENPNFRTAKDQFFFDQQQKGTPANVAAETYGLNVKSPATNDRKFTFPSGNNNGVKRQNSQPTSEISDQRLRHVDPKMIESVLSTIVEPDANKPMKFDDISGLESVKEALYELVIWPILNPQMFTGIKSPSKGLLLFGPPGTGKTLIAKCVAAESEATFFSISASTITSKWIGDGEKMVKALFEVARTRLPAVIFIDEVDSLLCQRSSDEHESSRRMKTEFLTQFDGLSTDSEERLLVIGATNRPQEIDEAARRRFVKRLYIPLPEKAARIEMVRKNLKMVKHKISEDELCVIGEKSGGFSGADMTSLCKDAAQNGIRELMRSTSKCNERIKGIHPDSVRAVTFGDFENALLKCNSSVGQCQLQSYAEWNSRFGTGAE